MHASAYQRTKPDRFNRRDRLLTELRHHMEIARESGSLAKYELEKYHHREAILRLIRIGPQNLEVRRG